MGTIPMTMATLMDTCQKNMAMIPMTAMESNILDAVPAIHNNRKISIV